MFNDGLYALPLGGTSSLFCDGLYVLPLGGTGSLCSVMVCMLFLLLSLVVYVL